MSGGEFRYVDGIQHELEAKQKELAERHRAQYMAEGALNEATKWLRHEGVREMLEDSLGDLPMSNYNEYLIGMQEDAGVLRDEALEAQAQIDEILHALERAKAAGRWVYPGEGMSEASEESSGEESSSEESSGEEAEEELAGQQ